MPRLFLVALAALNGWLLVSFLRDLIYWPDVHPLDRNSFAALVFFAVLTVAPIVGLFTI